MIDRDILNLISVNRDAAAVNRGFYFQYLTVLSKWVQNFINGKETEVFTEVGDDIKEVDGKIVFTQVKCYSSTFNLKSKEIHKALFNFFALYLEEKELVPELEFHFVTNTEVAQNEKLLKNWIASGNTINNELCAQCAKKVVEILHAELKKARTRKLNVKNLSAAKKIEIRKGFELLCQQLTEPTQIFQFVKSIRWVFGHQSPDESITRLTNEILELLQDQKFQGKPHHLLMESMLSEIYRCSQLADPELRRVDNNLLRKILDIKTDELNGYINKEFIQLLNVRFNNLSLAIDEVKHLVEEQGKVQMDHGNLIGNIHKILSNHPSERLPKDLTPVPFINVSTVIGRDKDNQKIRDLLLANRRVILWANGGMGKSILAKCYINLYRDKYDHIIWINAETGLLDAFIVNANLNTYLKLNLITPETEEAKFGRIIGKLNEIAGNNILIINSLVDSLENLEILNSLHSWDVLVTSRLRLENWILYPVESLGYTGSKQLYRRFEPEKFVSEELFNDFFQINWL